MTRREIYLDWNATTPPHPSVLEAMRAAAELAWANPSSVHAAGRRARRLVEEAREALAAACAAHPRDVVLTSGGTEANNLALDAAPALVVSRLEHPSVVRVAERLEARGVPVRWLPVPRGGRLEPEAVAEALVGLPAGALVAVMAANHETGVIQPLEQVAEHCRAAGARLHVDAVQALGKLEPGAWSAADSLSVAAHKLRGPKGIGALIWRGAPPPPVLVGGAQERGIRPGTLDPVLAAGFRAAVERLDPSAGSRLAPLRDRFEALPGAERNGVAEPRLPHVANLCFPAWRGDELVAALDLLGVCVSSGSACSAGTAEPSEVITAMLGAERARSAVRISLGETLTNDEVNSALEAFRQVLSAGALRESSSFG